MVESIVRDCDFGVFFVKTVIKWYTRAEAVHKPMYHMNNSDEKFLVTHSKKNQ